MKRKPNELLASCLMDLTQIALNPGLGETTVDFFMRRIEGLVENWKERDGKPLMYINNGKICMINGKGDVVYDITPITRVLNNNSIDSIISVLNKSQYRDIDEPVSDEVEKRSKAICSLIDAFEEIKMSMTLKKEG